MIAREVQPNGDYPVLAGRDALLSRAETSTEPSAAKEITFAPHKSYSDYFKIHKVLVGKSGGHELEKIGAALENEAHPEYLNVAGWAFAESALARQDEKAVTRSHLIGRAEQAWTRQIAQIEKLAQTHPELTNEPDVYRAALNLAHVPLMQAIIAGDVTESVRGRVFADTLAIAELSAVQLNLAHAENDPGARSGHVGFIYECNALLALGYANDPQRLPLPASARSDSGYEYRHQTHDIDVIHQKWGRIHRTTPVEIKSSASKRDRSRYRALIVRGKMHLSTPGKSLATETLSAFSDIYNGVGDEHAYATANHVTATMRDLLILYQKGEKLPDVDHTSATSFHSTSALTKKYREFQISSADS